MNGLLTLYDFKRHATGPGPEVKFNVHAATLYTAITWEHNHGDTIPRNRIGQQLQCNKANGWSPVAQVTMAIRF